MADAYWRYGESRQQANLPPLIGKRPRSDYATKLFHGMPKPSFMNGTFFAWWDGKSLRWKTFPDLVVDVPSVHELPGYFTRDDERAAHRVMRDTDSIGASYDRYLRSAQISSYGGGDSARPLSGGLSGRPADDARIIGIGGSDPAVIAKNRPLGLGDGRPELPLPPDATNTLFVEGLPANCTRREVSHIFRPFVGYKEVRLVTKESRHSGGDPLVLCFVDFVSPAHAATAMDALQGYKFDEHDRDSVNLRLQFARYPGARSGGGHRGKR